MLHNCTISGNTAWGGYGGGSAWSSLNNCTVTGNWAERGGGCYGGGLNNCSISGNSADFGGGSHLSSLNNCTLSGNRADYGGGSSQGRMTNCTVTANTAAYGGGGCYDVRASNCIIYHNQTLDGNEANYDSYCELSYCCTIPMPPEGAGNITDDPLLIDTAHIQVISPCVGAGFSNHVSGLDIDGDSWSTLPSIGCDEPSSDFGDLKVAIRAVYTNAVVGYSLDFAAIVSGSPISNRWDFGDGTVLANKAYTSHAWSNAGTHSVMLTVFNDFYPSGITVSVEINVVEDSIYYVDAESASPTPPYMTWGTAATNIQDAVDVAALIPGSTVWVSDGIYDAGRAITPRNFSFNRVCITSDIIVRSVNGPASTLILGSPDPASGGSGSNAVRGVFMSTGQLIGFTVTNGYTRIFEDYNGTYFYDFYDAYGGGINMYGGNGIASNCVLVGNSADANGGGSCGGTLNNCTVAGNSGGGSSYGTLNYCILSGNADGGSYEGTLNNCSIFGNSAFMGGGSSYGILNNCMIFGNSALYGGGSSWSTLNNCSVFDNSAEFEGGGSYSGVLNNCTVTSNTAEIGGGVSYRSTVNNCIVYFNKASDGTENNFNDTTLYHTPTLNYCCTTPLPETGTGNISADPLFVNDTGGDFHLATNSPCINAGFNGYVNAAADLDGNPRIVDGTVDMGAYESGFSGCAIANGYASGSEVVLEWTAFPMWNTSVLYSTNLVTMPFTNLSGSMAYPLNTYTDAVHAAGNQCFYKVEIMP